MRTASAKKSFGEYKPVMVTEIGGGRKVTKVLGQRGHLERVQAQTKFYEGPSEIWHAERGLTFKTRSEAIEYAQKRIDALDAHEKAARDAYEARHVAKL